MLLKLLDDEDCPFEFIDGCDGAPQLWRGVCQILAVQYAHLLVNVYGPDAEKMRDLLARTVETVELESLFEDGCSREHDS